MNVYTEALKAERRLNKASRDLQSSDHEAADVAIARAYAMPPSSPGGIVDLVDLVLKVEICDPHMRNALEAIREGARRMSL